jgi:hypothetical protein
MSAAARHVRARRAALTQIVLLGFALVLASSASASSSASDSAPRAPSGPPLSVGVAGEQGSSASAPPSGEDALVGNGLGSPLCRSPEELPASAQQDCDTDDFIAAPDPTGDYAFDVNINTGIGAVGNYVSTTTQDIAGIGWMIFVSVTHGLIVMLEWCYSLHLLSGSLLGEVTRALHESRLALTEPWLVLVLSIASMLAAYHGLLRRRVTETLTQTLVMLAMMGGGLWVIADPEGTVGALQRWVDQAALGTFATVAGGSPNHPQRTLASNMQMLFAGVVGTPWCYLEFGDVQWCGAAGSLDANLHSAALAIARREQSHSGCGTVCTANVGAKDRALATSATLLRQAQTNGQLFLALPANETQRNSVTTHGTLLNVLCGNDESADKCSGPTAAQAEFRTQKGTQPRLIGLCLILTGGLGMLLLFGFIALRLLTAALLGLFYLLLAPAAVLAPAFGERGRAAFARWAARLLGALVSKLLYSFVLGVVLVLTRALLSLALLGWLAQWLLLSAFWWAAFAKRHQTLGLLEGDGRGSFASRPRSIARRAGETLEMPVGLAYLSRAIRSRSGRPAPEIKPRPMTAGEGLRNWLRTPLPDDRPSAAGATGSGGDARDAAGGSSSVHGGQQDANATTPGAERRDTGAGEPAAQKKPIPWRQFYEEHARRFAEEHRSPVLDDARAVKEGRKAKLGLEPKE